jgi:hypothetical protein
MIGGGGFQRFDMKSYDDLFDRPPGLSSTMKESAIEFNLRCANGAPDFELSPSVDLKLQSHNKQVRDLMKNTTSYLEEVILNCNEPIEINEIDEITVGNYSGIWANKSEAVDWKGQLPINEYAINQDASPEIINKKTQQKIDYIQELGEALVVFYLAISLFINGLVNDHLYFKLCAI